MWDHPTHEPNHIKVAEVPIHRGRQMLREQGFGAVNVHSLLIYGSA